MRIAYLVDFDRQITPLPLSLSKSRWPNWLAAQATRQGRVGTTAQLRWQAARDQLGVGHGRAAYEVEGLGHAANTMRREQQVWNVADRVANRNGLFWEDVDGSLDAPRSCLPHELGEVDDRGGAHEKKEGARLQ
jgi:hypothetical protein